MTSEEVVEAAMAVCKKLENTYNYSLEDTFRNDSGVEECGGVDW
jgi:hypothetical protein